MIGFQKSIGMGVCDDKTTRVLIKENTIFLSFHLIVELITIDIRDVYGVEQLKLGICWVMVKYLVYF